jgi:hypothetical protein
MTVTTSEIENVLINEFDNHFTVTVSLGWPISWPSSTARAV